MANGITGDGKAETLAELLPQLNDTWYDENEGIYAGRVPTFGPETEEVKARIGASCADGDIVSWDTRDADVSNHLYLVRRWTPASQQQENEFAIERHADAFANYTD